MIDVIDEDGRHHCPECLRVHRDHGPDGECMAAGHYGHHWNPVPTW